LKTDTNDIFYFNFHAIDKDRDRTGELDAGFTMLAGSTGVGKTTVLSFLLAQSLRFQKKPKMIIFDKDSGSSVFVKALGGNYKKIKTGAHTGLQPFKCENTPRNVNFCTFLIKNITKREGVDFTAKEEDEITRAVITNLKAPSHLQSITAIRNNLPNDNDNSVYARLKSWIGDGVNAWVFDNHGDSFDFSGSGVNGIDYTEFLDNETVCTPILMYLFHKVEELIDGEPLILSMDEVWKPFQNKACADFINDKTRTIRKRNGIGVFSSQSPDDFINGVSSAFLEQMNTKIFLPNLNAKHSEYTKNDQGKGFGLTDEEFKLIKELPEKSRKFLVKQGSSSVVCKLDLHDVKELDILSGTEERAAIADELIAQYPNDWVNRYYDEVKKRRA
jgi:type IV secretion system protein VirB4